MSYKAIFLLLAALVSSILARPPDVTFLCNEMPEICTNMCWAVRCAQPSFPQTFALNLSSLQTDHHHRTTISASCRINSLCGNLHGLNKTGHRNHPYSACNIYPFSITAGGAAPSHAPQTYQVTRCVPEEEQCKQRVQLELLSKRLQKQSEKQQGIRQLSINFGNPGGIKYCNNDPCLNDGFEVQGGVVRRRSDPPIFNYYKTRSGIIIASLDEIETPSVFTRRVGSSELVPLGFATWLEEAGEEMVHMMEDAIVQRVSAQSFAV